MIDIHHHLLWDLDDGARTIDDSVAMARVAAADGITHVVCTPHSNSQYVYDYELVARKIDTLEHRLIEEGIDLKLGRGCDFHLSYDNIQEAKLTPSRFSINGMNYLLVELPDFGISHALSETYYQLQIAGLTPILTHPERNSTLQSDKKRMVEWIRGGVLVQVTAGSVLGHMGKQAQRMAHQLLADRWVHFIATDAHNITSRPPKMREAYELIAEKYDSDYAHALCVGNPLAVFLGKPLLSQAEPLHIYENLKEKSWWRKLTGR